MYSNEQLKKIAYKRRLDILELGYSAKAGHIGGAMSCIDILTTLYYNVMDCNKIKDKSDDRDRFVLSKGHCAEALYSVLSDRGFFPSEELSTYAKYNTRLAEHPTKKVSGVEISTGALGHGSCAAAGIAKGLKQNGSPAHVYTLLGDGEMAEGSVWESFMSAAKFKLDNLTVIIDRNKLQISGGTEEVMPLGSLFSKLEAFGFSVIECDGHDYAQLYSALKKRFIGMPTAIIANTVKGKGCCIMENKASWHHKIPSSEEYERIKNDLEAVVNE